MRTCICYFCSCVSVNVWWAKEGAILQHNSSYMVAYNGYIQTDLAQINNVYLFSVLTFPWFFWLVVLHPICWAWNIEALNFELCMLVAQNHSIRVAKPFDPRCKTIRIALQNHSNCVAKPFESRVAKPFELRCQTIRCLISWLAN